MTSSQPGILPLIPENARYLELFAKPDHDKAPVLRQLAALQLNERLVVGLGPGLVRGFGLTDRRNRTFPALSGPGCEVPSTQADLWLWLRGEDRGEILHAALKYQRMLEPAFHTHRMVDGFRYKTGFDLTGYEDGTENPKGDDATAAAIRGDGGEGMIGSSYVAVQQWYHDLNQFEAASQDARDDIIGRRQSDNTELLDAPSFAHVKRTAQEDFDPEAFLLRRSMPWADATGEGLYFVAFGKSFDAFEAQLTRMVGLEDGVIDGLFRFSRPLTGSYYWCPPVRDGHLDLSALGL